MKFVRRIDDLGRIVIPKELRKELDISIGSPLEISLEGKQLVISKSPSMKDSQESCKFFLETIDGGSNSKYGVVITNEKHTALFSTSNCYNLVENSLKLNEVFDERCSKNLSNWKSYRKYAITNYDDEVIGYLYLISWAADTEWDDKMETINRLCYLFCSAFRF